MIYNVTSEDVVTQEFTIKQLQPEEMVYEDTAISFNISPKSSSSVIACILESTVVINGNVYIATIHQIHTVKTSTGYIIDSPTEIDEDLYNQLTTAVIDVFKRLTYEVSEIATHLPGIVLNLA